MRASSCADPFLDGALGDQAVHLDRPGLPDPVGPVGRLVLDGGVPPPVEVHDVVGADQVEAGAAGLEGQQEDRDLPGLEGRDHRLALRDRGAPVEQLVRHPDGGEVLLDQAGHRDVLGEDEHRAALGDDRGQQLLEQVQLLGAPAQPPAGLLEELRRVVADLLAPGQQWNGASFGRNPLSCAKNAKYGILMPEWWNTPAEANRRIPQTT